MAIQAQKVVDVALSYVGYHEKSSNNNLEDFKANSGSGNFTIFAKKLDDIGFFYNGQKQGYAWCDCFVDYCFVEAYGVETALKLLCQPRYSAGAGCTFSLQYYKQAGQFYKSPNAGDQIFFGTVASSTHTGIVYKVDSLYVYTVEGNSSDMVVMRKYLLSNGNIAGYGRPTYEDSTVTIENNTSSSTSNNYTTDSNKTDTVTVDTNQKSVTFNIELEQLSKGSAGSQVKTMQMLLIANGYSCGVDGADGDFGSNTLTALKRFQSKSGLAVDGIYGQNTALKLIKG